MFASGGHDAVGGNSILSNVTCQCVETEPMTDANSWSHISPRDVVILGGQISIIAAVALCMKSAWDRNSPYCIIRTQDNQLQVIRTRIQELQELFDDSSVGFDISDFTVDRGGVLSLDSLESSFKQYVLPSNLVIIDILTMRMKASTGSIYLAE